MNPAGVFHSLLRANDELVRDIFMQVHPLDGKDYTIHGNRPVVYRVCNVERRLAIMPLILKVHLIRAMRCAPLCKIMVYYIMQVFCQKR